MMKKEKRKKLSKQSFIKIFFDVSNVLPFALFLVVPFLYDKTSGYSLIICVPIAALFVVLSSN